MITLLLRLGIRLGFYSVLVVGGLELVGIDTLEVATAILERQTSFYGGLLDRWIDTQTSRLWPF